MINKIIPAVLCKNYEDIADKVRNIKNFASNVQIDICDGAYVEGKTWPFFEYTKDEFIAIGTDPLVDVYLPKWQIIDYSADMMVSDVSLYIDTLIAFGFSEVIVHFNSLQNQNINEIIDKCQYADLRVAMAIDLSTDLDSFLASLAEMHDKLIYIQIMGIAKLGKQGQAFDERVIELINKVVAYLDENEINLEICIDGGMNDVSVAECKDAGANMFVVGSYLSESINMIEDFKYLENI
jgi:ribulose-phosphate 3-epimerase